jgi:transcriptional regulator with XRE-family HTH domain
MPRNEVLVTLRRARGWTQEDLAQQVAQVVAVLGSNVAPDARLVSAWERGEIRWPQRHYRHALRMLFGVTSDEALGFIRPGKDPARRHPRVLVSVLDFDLEGSTVRRADFLKSIAGVAFGLTSGEGLQSWLGVDPSRSVKPRVLGASDVAAIEQTTARFAAWDRTQGGILSVDAMLGQLNWAATLLDKGRFASEQVRRRMFSAVANLAEVAGFAAYDAGMHAEARRAFLLGIHAAAEAEDWPLRANVLSDMARQAITLGHPEDGLDLMQIAIYGADGRATPATQAMLQVVLGRVYGAMGKVRECRNAIAKADDVYEPPTDEDPAWISYYIPAQLAGDSGVALYNGSVHDHTLREVSAQRLSNAAANYGPAYPRSTAFCLAKLTVLRLDQGEPDEAATLGRQLLELADGIASARLNDDYRLIRAHAKRYQSHGDVAELVADLP